MPDWVTKPLGEVVTNHDSRRIPLSGRERETRRGPYPYYGAAGIIDYIDEPIFNGLHLLIGEDGSVVRDDGTPFAQLADGEFWVNNHAHVLRADSDTDTRFVYYAISRTNVRPWVTGAVQPKLNQRNMNQIPIPFPEPDVRSSIVHVLGSLDDKIEQNRRTARTLERLARAIFRAWFVDFEPVKAKAAGATSFPSMPQDVFDALPTQFVDSAIGPVPEGWNAGAISDLAALSKTQVNPQESPGEVFDHFSIPAFDAGMRPVVEAGSTIKSNKFLVVGGCVLLSKLNPRIARVWLPPAPRGRRQIGSTEFLVFVPTQTSGRHYLYCQFQQTAFRGELAHGASGTSSSHQRVRPEDVLNRPVVVPPAPTREAFASIADPLFALGTANHDESARLAEMRDYLLPKLLSGQARVEVAHG